MKKILLISFLLTSFLCQAQYTSIHFDKPYYFAGEYVFFSFCSGAIPDDTISAKIDLFNESTVITSYFVTVSEHCGEGYIKLPFDTPTGKYQLNISIFASPSFVRNIVVQASISLYNDADEVRLAKVSQTSMEKDDTQSAIITTTAFKAVVRNTIPLQIDLPGELLNQTNRISMVVRDQNLFGQHHITTQQFKSEQVTTKPIRGLPFFGLRELVNESTIRNHLLFGYNPEEMVFDGAGVDLTTGSFTMEITPFFDQGSITFLDYLGDQIKITDRPEENMFNTGNQIDFDAGILEHLKLHKEEKQINRLFRQVGLKISLDSLISQTNKTKPISVIDVQDYAIRGTMVNLFKELATSLKFRTVGSGNYEAKLLYERNGLTKFYSRPPLFIVNNSATYDGVFMAKIPLQEIKYISIYNDYDDLQKLSSIALGGLVYLEMIDPNYALPIEQALPTMQLQGIQSPLIYPVTNQITATAPATGSLLYWNPSVPIAGSILEVEILTNDISSNYLVEIVMHLKDGHIETIRQVLNVGIE